MTTRTLTFSLVLLALAAAPGCDSSDPVPVTPPAPILVNGTYAGTANVGGAAVSITLTLTETNQNVSGSGTLRGSEVLSLSVTGTHVDPAFNFTLRSSGFDDLNFAGVVQSGGGVLRGDLNGSGFDSVTITLNRA